MITLQNEMNDFIVKKGKFGLSKAQSSFWMRYQIGPPKLVGVRLIFELDCDSPNEPKCQTAILDKSQIDLF